MNKFHWLQRFAGEDGAAASAPAASGTAPPDGEASGKNTPAEPVTAETLRQLGVPDHYVRRWAAYQAGRAAAPQPSAAPAEVPGAAKPDSAAPAEQSSPAASQSAAVPAAPAEQPPIPPSDAMPHAEEARILEQHRRHILGLERQAAELQKTFPGFDLRRELTNPRFSRLTSPQIGLTVEEAYHLVHRQDLQRMAMAVAARKTAEKLSNAVQSGSLRPSENGASAQAATVPTFDYRRASDAQRAALKQAIRDAAAHGRKIYPGREFE